MKKNNKNKNISMLAYSACLRRPSSKSLLNFINTFFGENWKSLPIAFDKSDLRDGFSLGHNKTMSKVFLGLILDLAYAEVFNKKRSHSINTSRFEIVKILASKIFTSDNDFSKLLSSENAFTINQKLGLIAVLLEVGCLRHIILDNQYTSTVPINIKGSGFLELIKTKEGKKEHSKGLIEGAIEGLNSLGGITELGKSQLKTLFISKGQSKKWVLNLEDYNGKKSVIPLSSSEFLALKSFNDSKEQKRGQGVFLYYTAYLPKMFECAKKLNSKLQCTSKTDSLENFSQFYSKVIARLYKKIRNIDWIDNREEFSLFDSSSNRRIVRCEKINCDNL